MKKIDQQRLSLYETSAETIAQRLFPYQKNLHAHPCERLLWEALMNSGLFNIFQESDKTVL